ncbi:hypothetical protein U2063_15250, partial [Listeria monocytogenes]|uniref:hypothetical protein n=1 Tax=Listeria monocytogenes TaxID=1639 RepID=UPI002FDC3354
FAEYEVVGLSRGRPSEREAWMWYAYRRGEYGQAHMGEADAILKLAECPSAGDKFEELRAKALVIFKVPNSRELESCNDPASPLPEHAEEPIFL